MGRVTGKVAGTIPAAYWSLRIPAAVAPDLVDCPTSVGGVVALVALTTGPPS